MKKILAILCCMICVLSIDTNIYAGTLNDNEQTIIDKLSNSSLSSEIEDRYINQLENYFSRQDVSIEKADADDFILYLDEALRAQKKIEKLGLDFDKGSEAFKNFQKAGEAIGLLLEYDSGINDFYAVDQAGYIVIDSQKVIKDTDSAKNDNSKWNISIELIFAAVIGICILGLLANVKRWSRKLRVHNEKNYIEDEDEDELEVANRKTRRARLQTISYISVKQILKYFYVPIIMGLFVVGVGYGIISLQSELIDCIQSGFVNTQPIYIDERDELDLSNINNKDKEISYENVVWPKYSEQYGKLTCSKLKINAPVYFGDCGSILEKGAGTYSGSSIPGANKTILIGAHDTTYFEGLEKVKENDVFDFTTTYGLYQYKVKDIKVYDKDKYDEAYSLDGDKEQLVLYTCYPFGKFVGDKEQRMFVYLEKISGPEIQ